MSKKILLFIFLISGIAFSQTTVTLQDQCNCEVLSGTAVTAPGATAPTGADIGDIYVNTNTGTIYFWDGTSWELTSSDNQQLQNFSFNGGTNQLTLVLENGGTLSVDLSSLNNIGTDDQTAAEVTYDGSASGLSAGTVQLAIDEISNATNTVNLIDNTDGTYTFTKADGTIVTISDTSVSTLINNGDATFTYTSEDGSSTLIDIRDFETLTAIALNADNTNIDYTDEDGVVTQLNLSAIVDNLETVTTIVANANGTFTYTDEDGVDTIIDITNLETLTTIALNADNTNIDYTDEDGVVTQLNLSAIVDNLETVTTIVANANGTFTYTDEDGVDTIIDITNLETLTTIALNADNTNIDYTDEDGVVTQLNLSAIVDNLETVTTIVANANGTFTYSDEDGVDTIIDITNLETLTTIALNADNTNIDYTDEDGVVTQLNLSAIVDNLETVTTIVANANGTFTYTDEDGVDTIIDITNLETLTTIALNADNTNIDYTDEDGVVTQLNLSAIVDNLETVTTIVANANGTFTYKDEDGIDTIIDITNLETLTTIALNADNTNIDYTDEDGVVTQLNLSAIVDNLETVTTIVANANGTFTYTDEDGVDTIIDITNLETLTTIALNADNTNIDYTDEDGVVTQLNLSAIVDNLETVTTIVANANGTFTYTDEDGVDTIIDITNLETLTTIALNADNTNIDYTDEDGVVTQLNLSAIVDNLETVTTIVANANGTFTYTDEDGVDTIIDITNLETLTTIALNADNTNIDYTDEDGVVTQLNLSAIVDNLETVTTIVANANGTFTYKDEDGIDTIIDITNLETLTTIALNADNTNIDYTDEDGVVTQLNLSAIVDNLETVTTIVANANGTFTYTDEDGVDTIIDITNLETLTTIALNADNTNIDYTDEDGVVTQLNLSAIVDNLETVTTIVANANGTFTYTDEDGVDTIIDITNLETLTTIALNADNTNIDYTDEDGVVTQLNLSAIVDNLETVTTIVANANGTFTYTDESGVDTIIDITNLETLTTIALNADNTNIDYTDEDGVVTQLNLSAIVDNLETVTTIVANANGTFTYTDESGVDTIIDITNLETLTSVALNADNANLDYTDEDGVVTQLDLSALVDNLETVTTMVANPGSTFTYTDESGIATIIDIKSLETLTTILNNGDGTITYTDELGVNQVITVLSTDANNDIIVGTDGGLYLNVASVTVAETVTNLVDNNNGTITYTNEEGTPQTISKSDITDNLDGTYTFTNNDGSDVIINTNGVTISNVVAGNRIATVTNAAGASSDINETITTLTDNLNGTFTYTSENGTATTFDSKIASVVDNLDGTYTITDDFGVSVTVDTNNTVTTLVDNGNGSFTYTSEDGTITTFTETLSTLVDNANGTFTYTNEDGIATTFDSKIASVVDNLDGTYSITDDFGVSVTVDTNNTVTTLVDNGNGSFTYTSEDGTITTFTETLSTLVDNANGTFTYTNEDGIATTFDSKIASVVDNLDGTYTITDDFGVSVTVDTNNTVTTLVDNGNGSFTYTSEDGTITTFTETLSTLVDNANGTFTYTNEDGIATTFDSKIASVVDNLDGTYTITDDFGVSVTVDTNNTVTTLVDNGNGSFTYTSEDGTITTFTETLSTLVDNANGTFTYTNEDGVATTFDAKRTTALDNGDGTFTITDDSGNTVNIDSNQLAGSLVNNGDGTITYTDGTGPSQTIDLISNDANNDIVVGTDGGLYLNVASVTISETITNISDTGDGTITYVNESGTTQKVNKANITDNLDGTYTFTNNDGTDVIINTNGVAISNVIAGNRIATVTDAAGTVTDIDETITTLADNGDGTFTHTSENGTVTLFDAKRATVVDNANGTYTITDDSGTAVLINTNQTTSSLVDNGNGTYTYTDETGTPQVIDTRANSNPYTPTSGLTSTDVQGALDELAASNAADNDTDPTNEIQSLTSTDGSVTLIKTGDDYNLSVATFDGSETKVTGAGINTVTGTGTIFDPYVITGTEVDGSTTNEVNTAFEVNGTNLEITDSNSTLSVPLASLGTDDQIASEVNITDAAGNFTATEVEGALAELAAGSSDDQTVTDFSMDAAKVLTITLEDGNTQTVDLSSLNDNGTDDQALSLVGNILTLEDGGTVDLTPYLDNIDNQQISFAGNILTLGNGTGADTTVDLSGYISTDDQALTLVGNNLSIEDGNTVVLPTADGTETKVTAGSNVTVAGDGSIATPYVVSVATLDDADADPTNEFNTGISLVGNNLTVTDAGGNQTVDISGINTDTQDLSIDATGKIISLVDGGSVTIDADDADADPTNEIQTLTSIDGSVTLTPSGDDYDLSVAVANGTETKVNAGANVTVAGDGSIATPYVVSVATLNDADADPTNELITSANLTGTDLNIIDAGGTTTIDLSSLNNSGTDDQALTLVGNNLSIEDGNTVVLPTADGTETKVTAGSNVTVAGDGSIATPYVVSVATLNDADADPTNEFNTGISLVGNNLTVTDAGGNQTVDISGINTDTQDLSIDATGKIISLVDGGSVTIDADDADADPTNEIQNLNQVLATGNDAGAQGITNLLDPVNPQDAATKNYVDSIADDDITGVSFNTGTNTITVDEGTTTFSADLSTLSETVVGANDITVTDDGNGNYTVDYLDGDKDATNEYNTALGMNAGNLEITDNGGTLSTGMISTDANNDIAFGADGRLYLNVSSVTISETITNLSDAGDGTVTYVNENGITQKVNKANITDNLDGTYTFTNNDGSDVILDTRANSNPYNNVPSGLTATTVQAAIDELAVGSTDDQALSLVGNTLTLEDGGTVNLTPYLDNTDTQDLSIDATGKIISLVDGGSVTIDADDADADPTNEIQTLTSIDGSVTLTPSGDDYDLSVAVADGTETKVNAGANVTVAGDGSIATPYVVSVATLNDADADPTNELITSANLTGTDLNIIDAGGTTTIDLSSLNNSGTDDQALTLVGNNLSIEDGNTVVLPTADGTETKVTAGSNVTVAGDGSIATPYVVSVATLNDADADPTNEFNTGISLVGNNLTVTDAGGNQTVDISGINTDTQDLSIDATGKIISLVDGGSVTIDADDADADPTNELSDLSLAANILTLTNPATGGNQVDLSSYVNTDTQDLSIDATGKIISLVDGGSVTIDADDADADPTNELITSANLTGTDLNIIDAGGTTTIDLSSLNNSGTDDQALTLVGNNLSIEDGNTVVLPTADGTETKVTAGSNVTVAGDGSIATPYVVSVASLDDADADPTNEIQTLTSIDGSVTLTPSGDDYDLSVAVADGTETKVNAGANVTVAGDGSIATPYVVSVANLNDADADPTNELITSANLTGTDLNIIDAGGTTTIDLSSLNNSGTDDQALTLVGNNLSIEDGNTVVLPTADGTETKVTAGSNVTVAGDGSIATPYVVSVATLDDADADPTNEFNTGISLVGNNLTVTDAGGNQTVDISGINTDTQDLSIDATGKIISLVDGGSVTIDANDADADPTNEFNTGISLVGNNLTVTDAGGNQTVDISGINSDTQDLSIDATGKIISLVDGGSVTIDADDADADPTNEIQTLTSTDGSVTLTPSGDDYDLSVAVADGSETKVTGAGINTVTGSGTTASPYVVTGTEVDGSITNEVNTAFGVVGTDLRITDSNGTLSVPLASLGTDDQALSLAGNTLTLEDGGTVNLTPYLDNTDTQDLSIDATGKIISLVDGGSVTIDADDADADPTNELSDLNLAANILTLTNPATGGNQVDLSSYVNTDTQDLSIDATGKIISLVDGGSVTIDADDADADPSNELQTISRAGSDVTLSNGGGTVSINDADFVIGNEYNTNFAVSGTDLVITDGGGARAVPLATLGTDDQKIDKFVLNGTTLELSVESDGEADKTVNLNGTFATDAELAASDAADLDKVVGNEVTNATDATLVRSGSGTTASPYTLDVATGGITTTEILNGTIATVDLSDNSVTTAKIVNGTIATADIASTGNNKVLTTSAAGVVEWIDKSALVPATTVSNTSAVNTLSTTVNGVTGAGVNIINSNALSLTGSNLTSTVNGVASAALNMSSFLDNTDDQTAAEVNVVTPVDVDGDGTTEGTVEEMIQDIAPIVSKAARIFYPPSIAVDASTNGTFTIDLYAQYIAQYGSPTVGSAGAPAALPTYTAAELYYYVTYADPTVFNTGTMSIAADGKLTYTIIGQPSDYNSLINVVFVVK